VTRWTKVEPPVDRECEDASEEKNPMRLSWPHATLTESCSLALLREVSLELQKGCLGNALGEQIAVDQSFEPMIADECYKASLAP